MYSRKVFILAVIPLVFVTVLSAPIEESSENDDIYRSALENPDLFGGDIVLPESNNKFGLRSSYYRWPKNTIPYAISSDRMNLKQQIEKAMRHIEDKTCIRFVPHTTETDSIYIYNGPGCFSYMGRQGGKQALSLGSGCEPFGTISIMLYDSKSFSKNGKNTMTAKDSRISLNPVWMKKYLSDSDILSINKMYNCDV
ncbi:astacin-like metallopeptidase 10 protein [Leptotrombidium deliense]|uniref:Astacin-like metallopeptidase 10 protein n=1 Tax=Leptotrombidium deliense TaxID=299467 RepID=A0A443S9G3_9ACAR|nr:astacin-like metallopeptidase 10 protein [Leptotrombidium deliense]